MALSLTLCLAVMPPFRTPFLLLLILLVGMGGGGGGVRDGGVTVGKSSICLGPSSASTAGTEWYILRQLCLDYHVPVWLTSPGVGQIELGHDVWGDAPEPSPPNPALWTSLPPTGGPARPGKPLTPDIFQLLIPTNLLPNILIFSVILSILRHGALAIFFQT